MQARVLIVLASLGFSIAGTGCGQSPPPAGGDGAAGSGGAPRTDAGGGGLAGSAATGGATGTDAAAGAAGGAAGTAPSGGAPGTDAAAGGPGGTAGADAGTGPITCASSSPGALIDIGSLPGDLGSAAVGIDDAGDVLANSVVCAGCNPSRAFVWQAGTATPLMGTFGVPRVVAVNHNGRAVGYDNRDCATCFVAWDPPFAAAISFGTSQAIDTAAVTGVGDNNAPFGNARVQRGCSTCFHGVIWPPTFGNTVTDLGTIDGVSTTGSTVVAVNSLGQAVGSSGGRAVLWAPLIRDLGNLGAGGASAIAINDAMAVVGNSSTPAGPKHAFLWTGGAIQDLGTLRGTASEAIAVNARGDVAGNSDGHGFLWRGGTMIDLGTLGGASSTVVALNDAGQVTGNSDTAAGTTHAFLWQGGVMTDLGTLGGASSTVAGINASGLVVGTSVIPSGDKHAFLACPSGSAGGPGGSGGGAGGSGGAGGQTGAGGHAGGGGGQAGGGAAGVGGASCPVLTEFQLPTSNSPVAALTAGPDNALWMTSTSAVAAANQRVLRMTTAGGFSPFPTAPVGSDPHMILGPDGNLWYDAAQAVGRVTPAGVITMFPTSVTPDGLTVGPDGNIWFSSFADATHITQMTPTGAVSQRDLGAQVSGDLVYAQGAFWTTVSTGIGRIAGTDALDNSAGASPAPVTVFATSHQTTSISAGPDGSVWFATMETHPGGPATVGRVGTAGDLVEFPVSGWASRPAVGADGSAWAVYASVLGHINPVGVKTECPLPHPTFLGEIIVGPDQRIWLQEAGRIATFTP